MLQTSRTGLHQKTAKISRSSSLKTDTVAGGESVGEYPSDNGSGVYIFQRRIVSTIDLFTVRIE